MHYDYDIPSYEFCTSMLQESGALVTPEGGCFEEPHNVRIGYAYSDNVADLQEGLDAMPLPADAGRAVCELTVWSQQANRHCRSGPGEPTAYARGAFPGRR